MKELTKHQKKFWDYLKRESGIVEHRITGNFDSLLKKIMDSGKGKTICDGRHGRDIQVFNINKQRSNNAKEM